MKFIVASNPDEDGGGYAIRTDEHPVYFEYRIIYRDLDQAERFARTLTAFAQNSDDKLNFNPDAGWTLKGE